MSRCVRMRSRCCARCRIAARRSASSTRNTARCSTGLPTATRGAPARALRVAGDDERLHRRVLPGDRAGAAAERLPDALGRHLPPLRGCPPSRRRCRQVRRSDRLGQSAAGQRLSQPTARRLPARVAEATARAKATWRDHRIPDRWREKVDRRIHPHAKPADLIARLIGAITRPGDLVIDPAAGGFTVMHVATEMQRWFIGCDIACGGAP